MNAEEMRQICKDRYFDKITVVTDDIFREVRNLQKYCDFRPSAMAVHTERKLRLVDGMDNDLSYIEYIVKARYQDIELEVVQPVKGNTVYRQYLDRFGPGLCCIRERIPKDQWVLTMQKYKTRGLKIAQRAFCDWGDTVWLDLMDKAGILIQMATAEPDVPSRDIRSEVMICQINITTDDVDRITHALADLLDIGPWETGHLNNQTVTDAKLLVDGRQTVPEFEFLLGITLCGNIEFEVIQSVKGPTVYKAFVERRGTGFNHLKIRIRHDDWDRIIRRFTDQGIEPVISGKVGPCPWIYMGLEEKIGFLVEIGDDTPMTKLPDGYNAYFYPTE